MNGKNIVIIGAGLAGVTIANQLSANNRVTVIEKGSQSIKLPKIKYLKRSFGHSPTYCFSHGGTTKLWHNGLIDIPEEDVNNNFRNYLIELKKFTNKAAQVLNFVGDYEQERSNLIKESQTDLGDLDIALDSILIPRKTPPLQLNKEVNLELNVEEVKFEVINGVVKYVIIRGLKEPITLPVDTLIVCAGGIGSPIVLNELLSSSSSKKLNVGKNLIDHPMGFIGKVKVKRNFIKKFLKLSANKMENYTARSGFKLKGKELNAIFYIRPALTMHHSSSLYKFKSELGTAPWSRKFKMVFNPYFFHPDVIQEVLSHLFNIKLWTSKFSIWVVFEQRESSNFVSLNSNSDENFISWDISNNELEEYTEIISKFENQISKFIEYAKLEKNNVDSFLWSAAHHSGTCSNNKNQQIVDENLKVTGIDNAYVCDASVIPEHSYANTGLTIAKMALNLCDYLQER